MPRDRISERRPDRRQRSRSPSTRDQGHRDRRPDLRRQDDQTHHDHGRHSYRDNALPDTQSSFETLSDLPSEVAIPESGRLFPRELQIPRGRIGQKLKVWVNHFRIMSLPVVTTWQYSLHFAVPPSSQRRGDSKVSAYQLARAFLKAELSNLFGEGFVFDGVSSGWSREKLLEPNAMRTAMIDIDGHSIQRPNQIEITIRNEGKLNVKALASYLSAGSVGLACSDSAVEDCFKAFNAIYRQDPASKYVTRPNSSAFYHRSPTLCKLLQSTGGMLEAIQGMFQAVSVSFGGHLCLNVDTACSAFYVPDRAIIDVAKAFAGVSLNEDVRDPAIFPRFRRGCDRLAGLFFSVRHLRKPEDQSLPAPPAKKLRIKAISADSASSRSFELKDPISGTTRSITVANYFYEKYQIQLRYPGLPLLVSNRDGEFPMELCFTPFGERYKEPLQGQETADFIRACTSPPRVRRKQIMDHVKRLAWHSLPIPKTFGLSVATSMLEVAARLLPPPLPVYAHEQVERQCQSGAWNLRGKQFVKSRPFDSWGVLYFAGRRSASEQEVLEFCRELAKACNNCGMATPLMAPVMLQGNPQASMKEEVDLLVRKVMGGSQSRPGLLLFFLHQGSDPSIYKAIKNVCEIDGQPSQVMLVEKSIWGKGKAQYCANIALKLNCKLGGINSIIDEPLYKAMKVMMIGGDVSHPSPAELRRLPPVPSFCALVGTVDQACVAYTAVASVQAGTVELISSQKLMFAELINRYKTKNTVFPDVVIYWRDGISDHQVGAFLETEVKALKDVRSECGGKFKFTVVNCIKRHHTRFFPQSLENGDKNGNVLPCTIVENSNKANDFFCISQNALQGCVVPCHYVSLYDENKIPADDLQRLVLNGCFSYGRATRSVSLHPAVYYAHQVAERAKLHLRTENGQTRLHDVHADLRYTMVGFRRKTLVLANDFSIGNDSLALAQTVPMLVQSFG